MNIKAKEGGLVIHADDEAAKILIDAGIYDKTDEPVTGSPEALKAKKETRAPVAPLTTEDLPTKQKGRKAHK